ncbi:MAG: RNA polymerase sigma factor [Acidimicrobiia bacterium]|nr:RNA polymerase sigma factor [Acidimicrobiia bacterium]
MTKDAHTGSTVTGSGDAAMFTELLRHCDPQMRKLAYGMLRNREATDDALQLAYLKAFRNFDSFQRRSSFSTWLYTIVYRTCIDEIRRRRPDESIDSLGMSMSIDDALMRLPVDSAGCSSAGRRARALLRGGLPHPRHPAGNPGVTPLPGSHRPPQLPPG